MAGFFSKASSFLSSQAEHDAPSHGADKADNAEEARKPASSGAYGDLLAGAQTFLNSSKPSDEGNSPDKEGPQSIQSPGSGGYGELLTSAQSFMTAAKPDTEGQSADKKGSGGYGDLLASAQALMGSAKLSSAGDDSAPVDKKDGGAAKPTGSGDSSYGDVYASAQVLMGAAKEGAAADKGEVAGATANLLGAATRYGNLEKTTYGEYAHKAQTYLQDYQASHSKGSPQEPHKPSSATHDEDEESNPPPVSKPVESETPLKSSANVEDTEEEGSKKPMTSATEQD